MCIYRGGSGDVVGGSKSTQNCISIFFLMNVMKNGSQTSYSCAGTFHIMIVSPFVNERLTLQNNLTLFALYVSKYPLTSFTGKTKMIMESEEL